MKSNIKLYFSWAPYAVFFAVALIYFAFFGNYIFFYQEKSSLFIFSLDFLTESIRQPGGLLIWLGKFLSTFYYLPVAGAILVSSLLTLVIIFASAIITLLTGKKAVLIPLIIGASLFYLQTDYRFMLFNTLGFLAELAFLLIALHYRTIIRGWLPVLFVPVWFFISGGFLWIFLFSMTFYYGFYEIKKGGIRIIALWLITLVTFYLSKEFIFFQSGKTLMTFPFSISYTGSQWILFLIVAGIIAILPIVSKIRTRIPWMTGRSDWTVIFVMSVTLVIVMIIIGAERFDKKSDQYFHVEKLFYEGKYDEIIAYNTVNPTQNLLTLFLNNIALCETNKLDDMLFHFPQNKDGKTLSLKWEMENEILDRGGYFYYTIGMINEAHRWAYENMVMNGHSPEGIKMLIRTDLINGNYEVALRYINLLRKTLFYRKEAIRFEKLLKTDDAIDRDKELGEKRRIKIKNDFFSITDNPYINIEMILASDSLKRKPFEYKMAYMLLKKNFKGIVHDLPEFEKLGFVRLPVHVEEAAIALSVANKGILPYMGNLRVSKNTEAKWNQYLSVLQQYGNDPRRAEPVLRSRFGDTFWYYVFFK